MHERVKMTLPYHPWLLEVTELDARLALFGDAADPYAVHSQGPQSRFLAGRPVSFGAIHIKYM
jgi:hypothetical protein